MCGWKGVGEARMGMGVTVLDGMGALLWSGEMEMGE